MGISRDPPMFKASVGLLLRDDLHHAYDRLEWSLHYKVRQVDIWNALRMCADNHRMVSTSSISSSWAIQMPPGCTGLHCVRIGSEDHAARFQTTDSCSGIISSVPKRILGGFLLAWVWVTIDESPVESSSGWCC